MSTKSLFLFFYLMSFLHLAKAQKIKLPYIFFEKVNLVANQKACFNSVLFNTKAQKTANKIDVLPTNFYYTNLGFFCKQEIKIAKITNNKLPIAFRLGSLKYVDYLEGKPNTKYCY